VINLQILQDIIIWFSQEPIVWMITVYLVIINFLALMTMWWDKRRARNDGWRVSEVTLLIMGFVGGAIGLIIGMFRFHHKTRKRAFQIISIIGLVVSFLFYWIEFRAILWNLYLI